MNKLIRIQSIMLITTSISLQISGLQSMPVTSGRKEQFSSKTSCGAILDYIPTTFSGEIIFTQISEVFTVHRIQGSKLLGVKTLYTVDDRKEMSATKPSPLTLPSLKGGKAHEQWHPKQTDLRVIPYLQEE